MRRDDMGKVVRTIPTSRGRTILLDEFKNVFVRIRTGLVRYVSTFTYDPSNDEIKAWLDRR